MLAAETRCPYHCPLSRAPPRRCILSREEQIFFFWLALSTDKFLPRPFRGGDNWTDGNLLTNCFISRVRSRDGCLVASLYVLLSLPLLYALQSSEFIYMRRSSSKNNVIAKWKSWNRVLLVPLPNSHVFFLFIFVIL